MDKEAEVQLAGDVIFDCIKQTFGLKREDVIAKCRKQTITDVRYMAWLLLRDYGYKYEEITNLFSGNFDRTTISSGVKQGEELIQTERIFRVRFIRFADNLTKLVGTEPPIVQNEAE